MTEVTLKKRIHEAMVTAMRAQDKAKLGIIRLIQAAVKQQEVDERIELSNEQVLNLLDKMIRQRRESIKHFETAKRDDLIQQEAFEIELIQSFLPTPLSPEEIQTLIDQTIQQLNASSIRDMGKVMSELKPKLQGRADIGLVGNLIKTKLSQQ